MCKNILKYIVKLIIEKIDIKKYSKFLLKILYLTKKTDINKIIKEKNVPIK
ncbi:MAG: hypothetical protein BucCj_2920 [Buchnera aphidicola (Ceratovacuna japonica)]